MLPGAPGMETELENQTELVERIRQGDSAAEGDFVRHFGPRVLLMCVARTRDPEASRDLAQEVLLTALTALRHDRLHNSEKLSSFVLGVTRNLIKNFQRHQQQNSGAEALRENIARVTMEQEIENDERLRRLRSALERLRPAEREVLLMTLVDGCTPAEIASQLGITSEAVRTRKLRAMRKVMEVLKKMSRGMALGPLT
jgi:RNA polymerase sigma factor (sigma-70 family)